MCLPKVDFGHLLVLNDGFEAAARMAAMRDASGKPVVVFADEMAASAAYALAMVADAGIVAPPSGFVGSVGVISSAMSVSRALNAGGVDVRVFRSGAKKAVGGMTEPLSDDAAADIQKRIDDLAGIFAAHVGKARDKSPGEILALEGALFGSKDAMRLGLLDRVGSLEDAVRMAASASRKRKKERTNMSVASKLSLPEDASEADVIDAVEALQSDARAAVEVCNVLGAANLTDAVAKAIEFKAAGKAVEDALAKVAVLEGAIAARDIDDLIRKGRDEGKLTAASEQTFRELASANIDLAKKDLASRPVVIQRGEVARTEEKASGKRWEDYSVAEKARMQDQDPEMFGALLRDFRARTRGH